MKISVFNTKRILGAKCLADLGDPEILERVSSIDLHEGTDLDEALEREWETDAHFVMYHADDGDGARMFARINKGPFAGQLEQDGGRVVVGVLVFDHDLPRDSSGAKQQWSASSLESFLGDLQEAAGTSIPDPTAWYSTLHGSRFIYVLDEPVDTMTAEAMMRGMMTVFLDAGIELDDACKDWTRLFRLPNVEREGHGHYESTMFSGGPALVVADAPIGEVEKGNVSATIDHYDGEMPNPDEVLELLEEKRDNGRTYKSDLVKAAKKALLGRDAEGIIFEHKPIVVGEKDWDTSVMRIVGQTVGMLAREASATPEGIYALLHASLEQLQDREMRGANETNWYENAWGKIIRAWNGEQEQIEVERAEHAARQEAAQATKVEMIEAYREARPEDDVPEDKDEALEWYARRMIATTGKFHYVMRDDQSYNLQPCTDSTLIPTVRDLGMADVIPTTEYRGKMVVNRSSREIINDCAMPVVEVIPSVLEDIAYIDGRPGSRRLHVPIHRLNPDLAEEGIYNPDVDEWLQALGGKQYERLVEWLAHALDVKRSICALNLYGSPGTGKGLLALGISECFESGQVNGPEALGKFNKGLLKSPLVNCDEGVPSMSNGETLPLDQAFRSLVTGGKVMIRQMHTDHFMAELYPRIMFTSNDRDIISSIVGHRDLTDDDTRAIEQRLLSIEVSPDARMLLTGKGNFTHTHGWVAGNERTKLVVANHIYWLYLRREKSQTSSGRLLVEGDVQTKLVNDLRIRSRDAETVLRAIVKLITSAQGGNARIHVHEQMRVWVTAADIVEYVEGADMMLTKTLSMKAAARVLRHFATADVREESGGRIAKTSPPGAASRKRWTEIDLGIVYEAALSHGMNVDQIERMLQNQPGGPDIIARINA
jgi:hypothetical protein